MADHLLPVTPEQLSRLPNGVQCCDEHGGFLGRTLVDAPGHVCLIRPARFIVLKEPAYLDLSDTVTRAVVAACVVRPWMALAPAGRMAEWALVESAERMLPMSPDQITTLARLARAALEALTPPEPPPPPPR